MTLEEMFCDLYDKYGKDFNWYLLPLTQADGAFVVELNKEIGQGHFLSGKKIRAVAKCDSNDDVLYVVRSGIPSPSGRCAIMERNRNTLWRTATLPSSAGRSSNGYRS